MVAISDLDHRQNAVVNDMLCSQGSAAVWRLMAGGTHTDIILIHPQVYSLQEEKTH